MGCSSIEVERGGDATFHGPGQLVGYPILDLREHREDLHWYLRTLEEALIRGLDALSIPAERNPGLTGVWTRGRKIASIGIHVKQWVTYHGFALNINTDLSYFDLIVPCGIQDVVMTSVAMELGRTDGGLWSEARQAVVEGFGRAFDTVASRAFVLTDIAPSRPGCLWGTNQLFSLTCLIRRAGPHRMTRLSSESGRFSGPQTAGPERRPDP